MLGLLASLLVRSALMQGAAEVLRRMSRPSLRHAILLAGFVMLLLWPILAFFLPAMALPGWHPAAGTAEVSVRQIFFLPRAVAPHLSPVAFMVLFWASVVSCFLLHLLLSYLRLLPLARAASPLTDTEWLALLESVSAELGRKRPPAVLIYPGPLMPMTFGVFRPAILLPSDCLGWRPARRRIVLLHELAHIVRRDLLAQSLARIAAALWWFQPLCWTALRQLRRESENACDAVVLAAGVRPSEYASELLSIARNFAGARKASSLAIAMASPNDLEGRLRVILHSEPCPVATRGLRWAAMALLTAVTVAASAVTVSSETHTRGLSMKRTLFAGLLGSAGLSAATFIGTLYDPSGAAAQGVKALIYDPDSNVKFEIVTGPEGKFSVKDVPPGQYILRLKKTGFATVLREFNIPEQPADIVNEFVWSLRPEASVTASKPPERLHLDGAVAQSKLIGKVPPVYPPSAKAAGVQGAVLLEIVISTAGEPSDIRVISSPSQDLTQSAVEAVRQWRYQPTLLNGNPIEVEAKAVVSYTLTK